MLDPVASTTEFLSPFLHKASSFLTHALNAISNVHMPKFMLDIFDLLPTGPSSCSLFSLHSPNRGLTCLLR